ncbi:MAG: type II secretion system protein [Luteolibacter sp.]
MKYHPKLKTKGFTLVELLVVISIIAVLAVLGFLGSSRFIESGRKVQAIAQFRDFEVGMTMFVADYQKPPTPQSKRDTGWDTIYGDAGGNYTNQYLVSVLNGEDKDYPYKGESFSAKAANPRGETYMTFPFAPDNKKGVGKDGKLYDPWGREIMVAINAFNRSDYPLLEFNNGQDDSRLNTWGLAEYKETKPKDQAYVFWSYGKDGKKGKGAAMVNAIVPYLNSDDVISW